MARYTPSHTPIRNYAIAFFLSLFIFYSDISYQTFGPLKAIVNTSTLYVRFISRSIIENINFTISSLKQNKNLLQENKILRDKILQIGIKDFIKKKDNEEKIQITDFKDALSRTFESNGINIYKIASIDLTNYFCCSSHKIFLHNPNKINVGENFSVFAGSSFVGQTKKSVFQFH